jgi:hypothetical protein
VVDFLEDDRASSIEARAAEILGDGGAGSPHWSAFDERLRIRAFRIEISANTRQESHAEIANRIQVG